MLLNQIYFTCLILNLTIDDNHCCHFSVSLAPHVDFASYVHQYFKSGYLIYQDSGNVAKVCADHLKKIHANNTILNRLGESMCSMLEYEEMLKIEIITDAVQIPQKTTYVDMDTPLDNTFATSPCDERLVPVEIFHLNEFM